MRVNLGDWVAMTFGAGRASSGNPPKERAESARAYPLAALLFGPVSVLDPMSRNLNETTFADVAPMIAGTMLFALLVWLIAVAVRGRADATAALTATIWVVGSLFYLELVQPLQGMLGGDYSMVRPLPVALAAMVVLTAVAQRWAQSLGFLNIVVSSIAVVMLVTPTWRAIAYEWRNGVARQAFDADAAAAELPPLPRTIAGGADRPPDIYHFIFDRYGSEEVLDRHFGITDPIGAFLEQRGFYVARASHSNYLKTAHSLASAFHMDYLPPFADDPRIAAGNWQPLFRMLENHRVGRLLRDRGYRHLQFGSWWRGTYHNPTADLNGPFGFSEFNMLYLRRTILLPIFHLLPDTALTMRLDWDNGQCQRVARQIEAIKQIGEGARPAYVFAHVLVPHGPFAFAPDGRCLDRPASIARGETQGYIEQVTYADRIIHDLVTTLQAANRSPPVILIGADEGPYPSRDHSLPWQTAPAEELRIKTGILNAFYLPDGDYDLLRQDITPVNSYRMVFNSVFGTDFPELPDRIFAFPFENDIYTLHDVTARVRCERADPASAEPGVEPRCATAAPAR